MDRPCDLHCECIDACLSECEGTAKSNNNEGELGKHFYRYGQIVATVRYSKVKKEGFWS